MLSSKSLQLEDYAALDNGVAAMTHATCRVRGKGYSVYIPHEHRYWEYASALTAAHGMPIETAVNVGAGSTAFGAALCYEHDCYVVETDLDARHAAARTGLGAALDIDLVARAVSLQDMRDDDEQYDAVFCISVMEHVPAEEQDAAWEALLGLVRPGGLLGVTVDYCPEGFKSAERATHYTKTDIERLVKRIQHDFSMGDVDTTYHGSFVNDYTFFRIIARRNDG